MTAADFWQYLAPWLIMAVLLPAWAVLTFKLMPSNEWVEGIILDWADFEGVKVVAIDEVLWFGHFRHDYCYRNYRLRVVDEKGRERECKAAVGHFLLGRTYRKIAITWIKAR